MPRPSLVPLLLALAPAVQGPAGPVVLLGDGVDASAIPELAAAGSPVVLLSFHPDMDAAHAARIARSLGLDGADAARGFVLVPGERERSDDPELIAALREARAIGLWGGELEGWYGSLWPSGSKSGALTALREAHDAGATVVARGAGVALLSAAAVWDGPSTRPEPHRRPSSPPHDQEGPHLAWNLGLQPWAAVDTEARSHGSAWDLIDLLVDERLRLGVYMEDDSALVFDPPAGELRARGSGAVWLFDLHNARRGKRSLWEARFSVLFDGDAWVRRGRAVSSSGELLRDRGGTLEWSRGFILRRIPAFEHSFLGKQDEVRPWSDIALALVTEREVRTLDMTGLRDEGRPAHITLLPDEDSTVWRRGENDATLANLRLDLEWDLE